MSNKSQKLSDCRVSTLRKVRVTFGVVVVIGGALLLSLLKRNRPVTFPDGLSLQLIGVSTGSNSFTYGSPLQKVLNKLKIISPKGVDVLGFKLRPPQSLPQLDEEADLTAWLLVRKPEPFSGPTFYWEGAHVEVENADGRKFENPPPRPVSGTSNEMIMSVPLRAFPRDQQKLRLRVQPPPATQSQLPWKRDATRRDWAEFEIPNSLRVTRQQWKATEVPVTNLIGDLALVLNDVSTSPKALVRFRPNPPDWQVQECRIVDEEGNSFSWTRWSKENSEIRVEFDYGLESNRVWKVESKFIATPTFPMASQNAFPKSEVIPVKVSSGGPEVRLKDRFGTEFICRFDGKELSIRKNSGLDRPYLVMVEATEDGKQVKFGGGSAWMGRRFGPKTQQWWAEQTASNLTLKLVSPKIVETEFYVLPGASGR